MKKNIITAVLAVAALGVAATPADAAKHRYKVCDKVHSKSHNTRGTLIGAVGGGLLGHTLASGGGKTGGALIGAGAGAVAGHEIAKKSNRNCHYVYR